MCGVSCNTCLFTLWRRGGGFMAPAQVNVESLVLQNLLQASERLTMFTEQSLVTALEDFVKKANPRAISGGGG